MYRNEIKNKRITHYMTTSRIVKIPYDFLARVCSIIYLVETIPNDVNAIIMNFCCLHFFRLFWSVYFFTDLRLNIVL